MTRCKKCGRFIGNNNLGGYDSNKELHKGKAYCLRCVEKMEEPKQWKR